jgi:hypothetical protein
MFKRAKNSTVYPSGAEAGINESEILDYGNINLAFRVLTKKTGTKTVPLFTTVQITSVNDSMGNKTVFSKKTFAIIPTVTSDSVAFTGKEVNIVASAKKQFAVTGAHLGIFASEKSAKKYSNKLFLNLYVKFKSKPPKAASPQWFSVQNKLQSYIDKQEWDSVSPFAGILSIADITDQDQQATFTKNISEISVTYSMDEHTSIKVTLTDPGFRMTELNYFVPRRDMIYRGRRMEIADVDIQSTDGAPEITLTLCSKAIQQMKRSKMRTNVIKNISGGSPFAYARNAAEAYGLGFIGDNSRKGHSKDVFLVNENGTSDESVWEVLSRAAKADQKMVFEIDGTLIFGSQEWLMWKFGSSSYKGPFGAYDKKTKKHKTIRRNFVPIFYLGNYAYKETTTSDLIKLGLVPQDWAKKQHIYGTQPFLLDNFPSFETSDNDPLAASGSCSVTMPNGGQLRPGYTAIVGPLPSYFFGGYLISSVTFQEGSSASAQVSFRTPEELINQWIEPNPLPYRKLTGASPLRDVTKRNEGVYDA